MGAETRILWVKQTACIKNGPKLKGHLFHPTVAVDAGLAGGGVFCPLCRDFRDRQKEAKFRRFQLNAAKAF